MRTLDEELARYIAAEDGVTDWDAQPESYQADMLLYAQAAIRFFDDRRYQRRLIDDSRNPPS